MRYRTATALTLSAVLLGAAAFLLLTKPAPAADTGAAAQKAPAATSTTAAPSFSGMSYIDDGVIRLGVNLDIGGAITYLSRSGDSENVVNSHDWGRQIQLSFYSGPVPYEPDGKKPQPHWAGLGWNPIQSGDCFGNKSKVIVFRNDGKSIYVKCIPMQWPLDDVPGKCTYEVWITLDGNTARIRSRINNHRTDKKQYPGRGQECPAVYVNAPYHIFETYDGQRPFTGDKLTKTVIEGNWHCDNNATENWEALLRDDGWGLGIWEPGSYHMLGAFFGKPGQGGPKDNPTGYMASIRTEILDHNISYEYNYVLILGKVADIRAYVYKHAHPSAAPDWVFSRDRQNWYYVNATDSGWPIDGELVVNLSQHDPQMIGPRGFWKASQVRTLYIDAAYSAPATAQVYYATYGHPDFSADRVVSFKAIPDGKYHTYRVNMAASPGYRGNIVQFRFDPSEGGTPHTVRVKRIYGAAQ